MCSRSLACLCMQCPPPHRRLFCSFRGFRAELWRPWSIFQAVAYDAEWIPDVACRLLMSSSLHCHTSVHWLVEKCDCGYIPVNMLDLIWKQFWLLPIMAVVASASRIELDQIHRIWLPASSRFHEEGLYHTVQDPVQFHSSKEGLDHTVQNRPGSCPDGQVRIWLNASRPEASRCARIIGPGSGRMQPACYQFPTFRLSCIFSQTAHFILCKTSLDPNWFWLTVSRFGQTDLVPKPASVQESSGSLLAKAA